MLRHLTLAAATAAALAATPALAIESVTFANFNQVNTDTQFLSKTGATAQADMAVGFRITGPTVAGSDIVTGINIPANLLLNATLVRPAQQITDPVTSSVVLIQPVGSGTIRFTQTSTTALGGTTNVGGAVGTNLLTVTFTDAIISGLQNGNGGTFFASTPSSTINFTSDVIDIARLGNQINAFSIGLSGVNPSLRLGTDGLIRNFQANTAGTFSSAVPEPETWAMMILGFGMVGFAMRRRRTIRAVAA